MKQKNTADPRHASLLRIFQEKYDAALREQDASRRSKLLAAAPLFFCKWFTSALVENTILSPANILSTDQTEENAELAYVLRQLSSAEQVDGTAYRLELYQYSLREHPLIEDLKALVAFCTPVRTTDAGGLLLSAEAGELLEQLSLKDEFYLEYLTRLAWMQGLFVPMPAIHTKCLQPSAQCREFFAQSTAEILLQLGDTACALAAERFSESMQLEEYTLEPDFFRNCLDGPKHTDSIFVDFYESFDIDIAATWQTPISELSADQHDIIASFLYAGMLLDKWFTTPMGSFFHFIRPIHFSPLQIGSMLRQMAEQTAEEENLRPLLFSPPAYYSLTPLGEALFEDRQAGTEADIQKILQAAAFEEIMEVALVELEKHKKEEQEAKHAVDVLSIRVTSFQDPELWEVIEADLNMPLHDFCRELAMVLYPQDDPDYLLSLPDSNRFPVEYSAVGSKRSVNKTNDKTLRNLLHLLPDIDEQFFFYPTSDKSIAFTLMLKGCRIDFDDLILPRVTARSVKAAELERLDGEY